MSDVRRAIEFSADLAPFVFQGAFLAPAWPLVLQILPGWKDVPVDEIDPNAEIIDRQGLDAVCAGLQPIDIAYEIVNRLRIAVLEARAGRLCIHAGGIVTAAGRAILFAGAGMSGKSTIAAGLASRGIVCVGDDRVYIDGIGSPAPNIITMGLAQKVRLPLPGAFPHSMRQAIDRRHSGPTGEMVILNWDDKTQLPAGSEVPLAEIWILNRSNSGAFELKDLARGPAARYLIELSEIGGQDLAELVKALNTLTQTIPVKHASFSDSLEVIAELETA